VEADATVAENIAAAMNIQYRLSNFTSLSFVPDLYLMRESDEKKDRSRGLGGETGGLPGLVMRRRWMQGNASHPGELPDIGSSDENPRGNVLYNPHSNGVSGCNPMATIPIPFVVSSNGVQDSILATLGLWGILALCIALFAIPFLFFMYIEDEFGIRLMGLKHIFSFGIGVTAGVALFFLPFLLLPLIYGSLGLVAVVVYLASKRKQKKPAGYRSSSSGQQEYSAYIPPVTKKPGPGKNPDIVIDAQYRYIDDAEDDGKAAGRTKSNNR
jgi:hypothetical protein